MTDTREYHRRQDLLEADQDDDPEDGGEDGCDEVVKTESIGDDDLAESLRPVKLEDVDDDSDLHETSDMQFEIEQAIAEKFKSDQQPQVDQATAQRQQRQFEQRRKADQRYNAEQLRKVEERAEKLQEKYV